MGADARDRGAACRFAANQPPEIAPVETPRAGLATPRLKEPPQSAPPPDALTAPSFEALAEPVPDTPVELAELLRPETTEAPPPKPVAERIARLEPAAAPEPPRARAAPPRAPENAMPPPEPEETSAPEASPPPQSRPERAPAPPKTVTKPKPAPAPPPPETNPAPAANEMANDGAGDSAPASLAAGDGGGAEAGSGGADQALGSGASAALAQLWGGAIRREVEARKRFPRNVRRTGVTMVALRVARTGALVSSHVRESSGSKALDEAAIRAVRDAAPYAAAPDGLSGASFEFALPVVFRR